MTCVMQMTHREYLSWHTWLERQWNTLDKKDHYLMQIAQEVRRVLSKNPNQIKLTQFKIPFKRKKPDKPLTAEEASVRSRHWWFRVFGMGKNKKPKPVEWSEPRN